MTKPKRKKPKTYWVAVDQQDQYIGNGVDEGSEGFEPYLFIHKKTAKSWSNDVRKVRVVEVRK